MKIFKIIGKTGHSTIMIGEKLVNLSRYIPSKPPVIITDNNVWNYHHQNFPAGEVIRIGTGETVKNLKTVQHIYKKLVALEADRSTFVVGIGGGIVCDIAGFVASTFLRGVRFGFVASTLLAQVDASVGGKNGVNFGGYKNVVGVFNQPEFVLCDLSLLETLPEKERLNGLGEVVKHAVIGDPDLFDFLEKNYERAIALDPGVIENLVYASVVIKSAIVNRDETEKGERRKLNFGHTFGHAVEKTTGLAHGEAVALGMVAACVLSQKNGPLLPEVSARIRNLLQKLKLPIRIRADREKLMDAMRRDKKREGDRVYFVMLQDIGKTVVSKVSFQELEAMVAELV